MSGAHHAHTRTSATLTLAGARAAVDAALSQAASIGAAMNVAVVDPGGALLAFARMDGAFAGSSDIARDKARTVVSFGGAPTDELYAAIEGEPAVRDGIGGREGVAAFGGGVPVVVDGELVGAVGASGGSAAQDKQVAQAGADAVR
ncbi:GlcG/HbpS family heme-binding protein [Janibacter melonis]|uniref:GlcG/HbpS family heme-binding protein n=1 Tax=Janibacter melonis TaxID=262209 RepID=UPI001E5FF566|nr:heme-binding protein [Janibacter melonis]MCB5991254.1 heme-binding protein [Janibacter melonis]